MKQSVILGGGISDGSTWKHCGKVIEKYDFYNYETRLFDAIW
jgi:hypothetical protein